MKRSRFSEEQVAYALRQAEAGTAVGDVCRQIGVSEATFYVWKKRYGHLGVHEVRRVRMRVRRRKHCVLYRGPAPIARGPVERWSMDFVHDALADGRPFRVLTVVDQWSRQSPVLEVGVSLTGRSVADALDRALATTE